MYNKNCCYHIDELLGMVNLFKTDGGPKRFARFLGQPPDYQS